MAGRSDTWAKSLFLKVWRQATGRDPTLAERQYVQAVSALETGYGGAWDGSNNFGAMQCTIHKEAVPGHCVLQQDHHPDGTAFVWPYRVWPTPEEGAIAFLSTLAQKWPKTMAAAKRGDVAKASHELYGWYTGIGTREQGEAQHRKAVMSNAERIAKNCDEKLMLWDSTTGSGPVGKSAGMMAVASAMLLGGLILLRRKGSL